MFDEPTVKQLAVAIAAELKHGREIPTQWPEIMSVETAARYMDRSVEGVRNLVKTKVLPATRIDNRLQIRRLDIDRLAERKTV